MKVDMVVVQGRPAGSQLRFPPGEYFLGRGAECHVRFNSDWVSRQHCLLQVTASAASLRDLGSRNGTLVNGELLREERALNDGDRVQVGPVVFRVCLDAQAGEQDDVLVAGWGGPETASEESTATLPAFLGPAEPREPGKQEG